MRVLLAVFLFISGVAVAAIPQVPSKMEFAGIKLNIKPAAQKKIQNYVNQLRKSEKYHQAVVKKADLCFPLIERVFKEEGFPEDFKYLIIQETGFRADAVSKSNAVGYWQFKVAAGEEVGLKINKVVDERMNLASSSRGAARYVSKNNLKLDNWIYALLSYNVGPGGVMNFFKEKDRGLHKMDITGNMHWYVLKLLAHKVAFEGDVGSVSSDTFLFIDKNQSGKKLSEVAKAYGLTAEDLEPWNKWLKGKKVPVDKSYEVIIPIHKGTVNHVPVQAEEVVEEAQEEVVTEIIEPEVEESNVALEEVVGIKETEVVEPVEQIVIHRVNYKVYINGVEGIVAKQGDDVKFLAQQGGLTTEEFLRFNELKSLNILSGQTYFFHMKKTKAKASYHVVQEGETLWSISQKYGVRSKSILTKNNMSNEGQIKTGDRLFLRKKKPESSVSNVSTPVKTGPVTHTVKAEETLYGISKKYGLSVEDLKKLNGLLDNTISVGQVLKIR